MQKEKDNNENLCNIDIFNFILIGNNKKVYTGNQKFRSAAEVQNEFQGLEEAYNLKSER